MAKIASSRQQYINQVAVTPLNFAVSPKDRRRAQPVPQGSELVNVLSQQITECAGSVIGSSLRVTVLKDYCKSMRDFSLVGPKSYSQKLRVSRRVEFTIPYSEEFENALSSIAAEIPVNREPKEDPSLARVPEANSYAPPAAPSAQGSALAGPGLKSPPVTRKAPSSVPTAPVHLGSALAGPATRHLSAISTAASKAAKLTLPGLPTNPKLGLSFEGSLFYLSIDDRISTIDFYDGDPPRLSLGVTFLFKEEHPDLCDQVIVRAVATESVDGGQLVHTSFYLGLPQIKSVTSSTVGDSETTATFQYEGCLGVEPDDRDHTSKFPIKQLIRGHKLMFMIKEESDGPLLGRKAIKKFQSLLPPGSTSLGPIVLS